MSQEVAFNYKYIDKVGSNVNWVVTLWWVWDDAVGGGVMSLNGL